MYSLIISDKAKKDLKKIDIRYSSAISKALDKLRKNPKLGEPLLGKFKGQWKLKFSRYRIIYLINDSEVTVIVVTVAHRREVYR